jgi:hypothetical protein
VVPVLDRPEAADGRIADVANSSLRAAPAAPCRIVERFERVLSVEQVGRFRPTPEVSRMAAVGLGGGPGQMVIVAHNGQTAGERTRHQRESDADPLNAGRTT